MNILFDMILLNISKKHTKYFETKNSLFYTDYELDDLTDINE